MIRLAKARLEKLYFVTTSDNITESAETMAATLGKDLSKAAASGKASVGNAFMFCAANAQAKSRSKRTGSLAKLQEPVPAGNRPGGYLLRFSKEARKRIHEETLAYIREANRVDGELYEAAKALYASRRAALQEQGKTQSMPRLRENFKLNLSDKLKKWLEKDNRLAELEKAGKLSGWMSSKEIQAWKARLEGRRQRPVDGGGELR